MKRVFALAVLAMFVPGLAFAEVTNDQMMEMMQKMQRQMADMQRTIDTQSARIQELEHRGVPQTIAGPSAGASSMTENDWQKGIKDNIGDALPWMKGLKQGGDLRLRNEYFDFYDKTNDAGSTGTANDRSRNRFRARLRWGVEKDFGDDWKAGFRLVSGSSTDNASTNQTLGNRGYFTFKDIFWDRAYAQYSPTSLKEYGALRGVTIGAGKFENPFLRYSTTIMWDSDVTPEGLYEKASFSLLSTETDKLALNTAFGQFIVNENAGNETDAQLYGYQAALNWNTYAFNPDKAVDFSSAVSYYDAPNYFQTVTSNTASTSYLRTNTSALDNPKILDFYEEAVFYWDNTPITLWGNYVENVGEIDPFRVAVNEVHGEDTAWGLGFKVNKLKKKGDWEVFYGYYEIGANSVLAAFNDSDFGGPGYTGHTNRLGHKFGLGYQITDNIQFGWTNFFVEPLNATTVAGSSTAEKVWRSQADIVWKF